MPFKRKRRSQPVSTAPKREVGPIARGPCPCCGVWAVLSVAGCCATCSQPEVRLCDLESAHVAG